MFGDAEFVSHQQGLGRDHAPVDVRHTIRESIKADIPARIALRCASRIESRESLGATGAEKLFGQRVLPNFVLLEREETAF